MKRLLWTITGLGVGLTLWTHSAAAQVFGSPFYAVPTGSSGVTVSGRYGRGLNDESGEFNYIGGRIDVSGPDVSFWANGGPVVDVGDTDFTLGGGFAVKLPLAPAAPVHLTIQGGVGLGLPRVSGQVSACVFSLVPRPVGVRSFRCAGGAGE